MRIRPGVVGVEAAEKALTGNYAVGDERRVTGVDHARREVLLDGDEGGAVRWKPGEISRARDRAELVTDDKATFKEQLEAVTGERIAALEGIGEILHKNLSTEVIKEVWRENECAKGISGPRPVLERGERGATESKGMESADVREKPVERDLGI